MITLDTLHADDIAKILNPNPFRKARPLTHNVKNQLRQGNTLMGQVRGSKLYSVEALVENGSIHAVCSCPYDWGGYCKHIGALLLKWVYEPHSFNVQTATDAPFALIPIAPRKSRKPKQLPNWLDDSLTARQAQQMAQLTDWLEQYRLQELRALVKQHKWRVRGARKAQIAQQIAVHLTDKQNIAALLAALTPAQRATLHALAIVGNNPSVINDDLSALATQWHTQPADMDELIQLGLALEQTAVQHELFVIRAVLPDALMATLQPQLTLGVASTAPPQITEADPSKLLQQIGQLLLLLERERPILPTPQPRLGLEKYHPVLKVWRYDPKELSKLQQAGRLSATAKPALSVPPPAYALNDANLIETIGSAAQLNFYYHLLRACGLLYIGSPVRVWKQTQLQYVQRQPAEQHALLVRTYFEMRNWNELWELLRSALTLRLQRDWAIQLQPTDLVDDLQRLRQRVLRLLACLPDGAWVALADIERLLRPIWQTFDATAAQIRRYYYLKQEPLWRVVHLGGAVGWERGQRAFLQAVITTLHWLGVADIGRTADQLTHVRLHGLADLFWDRALVPIAVDTGEATIQSEDTLILVTPNAISGAAHTFLGTIGRLTRTEPTQFGYQLDAAAVHAAFEDGMTRDELLRRWRQHFDADPPAAIQAQLDAWWTQYGEVRFYDGLALLEFADDNAFAEMQAVTSLDDHFVAQLSPKLVLIKQQAVEILAAELQQAGYTPKIA